MHSISSESVTHVGFSDAAMGQSSDNPKVDQSSPRGSPPVKSPVSAVGGGGGSGGNSNVNVTLNVMNHYPKKGSEDDGHDGDDKEWFKIGKEDVEGLEDLITASQTNS